MSYEINLNFPHFDWTVQMPAVPAKGDVVDWSDSEIGDTKWLVTEVIYTASPDREGSIYLALDPGDDYTKERSERFKADRVAALKASADEEEAAQ